MHRKEAPEKAHLHWQIPLIIISGHCLLIKHLWKEGIEWDKRYCNLCGENEIGTEQYVMVDCSNKEMVELREQLESNLFKFNYQYTQFFNWKITNIYLLANIFTNYYFAIFLKKVFSLAKSNYTKGTSVPPWNESNGGIDPIMIGWIILWSVADLFDDIQINMF